MLGTIRNRLRRLSRLRRLMFFTSKPPLSSERFKRLKRVKRVKRVKNVN